VATTACIVPRTGRARASPAPPNIPRGGEQRRYGIPLRRERRSGATAGPGEHAGGPDGGKRDQQERLDIYGRLQKRKRSEIAGENTDEAQRHSEIPESGADLHEPAPAQRDPAQAAEQPQRHGKSGVGGPAVNERGFRRSLGAPESEPFAGREKSGRGSWMEWTSASIPPTASQTRPEASNSSSAQRADRSMAAGIAGCRLGDWCG